MADDQLTAEQWSDSQYVAADTIKPLYVDVATSDAPLLANELPGKNKKVGSMSFIDQSPEGDLVNDMWSNDVAADETDSPGITTSITDLHFLLRDALPNTAVTGAATEDAYLAFLGSVKQPRSRGPQAPSQQKRSRDSFKKVTQKVSGPAAVEQLDEYGRVVRRYMSEKAAAETLDIAIASISSCCNFKRQRFCGFQWRYYDGPG